MSAETRSNGRAVVDRVEQLVDGRVDAVLHRRHAPRRERARRRPAQARVRGRVERDHRGLRPVPALGEDLQRLGLELDQRQLRGRRGVRLRVEEDLLDVGVAGDHVVVERRRVEHRLVVRQLGQHRVGVREELGGQRVEVLVHRTAHAAQGSAAWAVGLAGAAALKEGSGGRRTGWRAGRAGHADGRCSGLVAVAVGDAAPRDQQDDPAGEAGADRGRGPVEAVVDALHDGRAGSMTNGSPVPGVSAGRRRALAAGAASARTARPIRTRRVMRCETFMTASFRGGRGWMPTTLSGGGIRRSTRGLLTNRPLVVVLRGRVEPRWNCGSSGRSRSASRIGPSSWAPASSGRCSRCSRWRWAARSRRIGSPRACGATSRRRARPKMVQLYVSHLRRALDGNGVRIVTHGRGYELELSEARWTPCASSGWSASPARARRSRSGTATRSPIWPTSRSPPRRSAASTSCGCAPPRARSTPTSRPAATPR